MSAAGPATNPPSEPSVFDSVPTRSTRAVDLVEVRGVGAEHGVGLVEHQQRAVAGAQLAELVDRGEVAVHREHRVGHDHAAGRRGDRRQELVEVVEVAVAVHLDVGARPGGSRR